MYDFTNISHTMSHKQHFTNRIVSRLRYHTRIHTMLPPCYSQLVSCTVKHSPCVPHYTIGSWFYAIVFFNHVHNPMDHDTNIMRSKLLLCSWFYAIVYTPLLALQPLTHVLCVPIYSYAVGFMQLYTQKNVTQATFPNW